MYDVFDDVSKGKYERNSIVSATKQHPACPLRFSENGQLVAMGKYFDGILYMGLYIYISARKLIFEYQLYHLYPYTRGLKNYNMVNL